MTEIAATGTESRRKADIRRMKRHNVKTDMTPMVDLGFLLIAFFVMTAELSKPSVVNLNMPKAGPPMPVGDKNALTILLDANDQIYYYHGNLNEALASDSLFQTNFSESNGLGNVIRKKQRWLEAHNKNEERNDLMLIIKPGKEATYRNVIDALDEALINVVNKYTVVPPEPAEMEWINNRHR